MNEDYEMRYGVSNQKDWERLGIAFLQLNTPDIFHSPEQDKLENGVEFILKHQQIHSENKSARDLSTYSIACGIIPWSIQNKGLFLEQDISNNNQSDYSPSVYVHCKAGRTRSATLVACYLIKVHFSYLY